MILRYIVKRVAHLIPTLVIVSFLVFAMVRIIPGDPVLAILGVDTDPEQVEELRRDMGVDQSILPQYLRYLTDLSQGQLGTSIRSGEPVKSLILDRLPATIELATAGMAISLFLGITLGIMGGLRPGDWQIR